MTDDELKAIREREQKATAEPWDFENSEGDCWHVMDDAGDKVIADLMDCKDAKFCAHARTDIPKLLDAVAAHKQREAELEASNKLLTNALEGQTGFTNLARSERDQLAAQLEAVKGEWETERIKYLGASQRVEALEGRLADLKAQLSTANRALEEARKALREVNKIATLSADWLNADRISRVTEQALSSLPQEKKV